MQLIFYSAIECAIVAFVYCSYLIREGHIFHGWFKWLTRKLTFKKKYVCVVDVPEEVKKVEGYTPMTQILWKHQKHWLLKPLGDCLVCTTGQLTVWVIILKKYFISDWFWWLVLVGGCLAIIMVEVLNSIYQRWIN